jgi:hypothetical protein
MTYWIELIGEWGKSWIYGSNENQDIAAYGSVVGISYAFDLWGQPVISFEYAFGSGDEDRISVTNTDGGNTSGNDKNFLYFGYLGTGFALAPRISNLHMYKIGCAMKPLEKCSLFKTLTLETNFFRFYKDNARGGVSDPDATELSNDIGSELDIEISWDIFSDLQWKFQYGYFMPGDAYPDTANDADTYLSTSLTLTF